MNDQEQPDNGTPLQADAAEHALANPTTLIEESVDDVLEEEELGAEEYSDDEDLDDNDADDLEDDDVEEERVRSLVEELFDEEDLGEVMSELDVLTLEDAATYLKVEYGAIRRMLKEQGLPGRKIGDEWRFLRGALADWLRAPGGNAPAAAAPAAPAVPARPERPAQSERREFTQRPPLRERFSQAIDEGQQQQRFPQQGGARYPQQGGSRYPQENRPPRRPQNEGGGGGAYQGGGGYQGNQGGQGGYQGGGQGQGGYPPPRRPRFGNDQDQQPQGEYRPPRRPFAGGQGGSFENQAGGNFAGGGASGSAGGRKYGGGPKKPKRKALNEQRFKRLDRRKDEGGGEQGPQDSDE